MWNEGEGGGGRQDTARAGWEAPSREMVFITHTHTHTYLHTVYDVNKHLRVKTNMLSINKIEANKLDDREFLFPPLKTTNLVIIIYPPSVFVFISPHA